MKNSEKEKIRSKLIDEINNTNEKIKKYTELCKPIAPENSIGRISRMDAINNKSVVEAALREVKQKMKQLQLVKTRIDADDFGICSKCEKVIPYERLMIRPHSKYCVKCAE